MAARDFLEGDTLITKSSWGFELFTYNRELVMHLAHVPGIYPVLITTPPPDEFRWSPLLDALEQANADVLFADSGILIRLLPFLPLERTREKRHAQTPFDGLVSAWLSRCPQR